MSKRLLRRSKAKIAAFVLLWMGFFGLLAVPSMGNDGAMLANGGCHCGH